jgi:putative transposase
LLGVSRQSFYASFRQQTRQAFQHELVLVEVARLRALLPRLGTRKLLYKMQPFLHQHHISLGRDTLFQLLAQHGLLIRPRAGRKPKTTQSNHWLRKYPNLLMTLIVNRPNQVWVADITYLLVGEGFGYLFLLTDAYSRKIIGHALTATLAAAGAVQALRMGIRQRSGNLPTVHHSDRGSQYCCWDYIVLLEKARIAPSMTQSGDPRENAIAERVNGILKSELLARHYRGLEEARQDIARRISLYNVERPHLSLDMLTPTQAHEQTGSLKRRWKSYPYKSSRPRKVPNDSPAC